MLTRRRLKQREALEKRLVADAMHLREQAKLLPPGTVRDEVLRRARQAETEARLSVWLRSFELQPPR